MTTTPSKVGFIGLGRMGRAMAAHLVDAGHDVIVHNRTAATADAFATEFGCHAAVTAREVAESCDRVLLMVADGQAVVDVISGADGLAAGLASGGIVADMGTTGHEHTARARGILEAGGARLVEAPVSGSTAAAEAKTLLVMAAGDLADIDRVEPLLAALGTVRRVGGAGTGAAMKLAVNAILFAINQATAEALVLAERAGVERSTAYDVFAGSAVAAPVIHYRRAVFEDPSSTPVTFSIELANKDLGLILRLADAVGASMPQAAANLASAREAAAGGLAAADMGEIATHIRTLNSGDSHIVASSTAEAEDA